MCEGFSTLPKHKILGARCICLTCVPDKSDFSRQISFCDDPECLGAAHPDGFWSPSSCGIDVVHRTTHDILKIRMVINRLHWPDLSEKAAEALKLARSPGELPDPPAPEDPHKPHTEDRESRDEGKGSAVEVESEVKTSISTPKCGICRELVYMGRCWHCLECGGTSLPCPPSVWRVHSQSDPSSQIISATSARGRCSLLVAHAIDDSLSLSGTTGSSRVRYCYLPQERWPVIDVITDSFLLFYS